jgi:hypothetical protein
MTETPLSYNSDKIKTPVFMLVLTYSYTILIFYRRGWFDGWSVVELKWLGNCFGTNCRVLIG